MRSVATVPPSTSSWTPGKFGSNADIETLTNKTKIKVYHEHDLDTLLGILSKNRKKLGEGVNPKSRAFQEAVEREFTASVAKVAPLDAKLEATDRLIDQIVYKLYGLTEEEIGIVEGNT